MRAEKEMLNRLLARVIEMIDNASAETEEDS